MSQGHSMRNAAKAMNTPFSSLQKRLKKNNSSEPRLRGLPVFTADVEKIFFRPDNMYYLLFFMESQYAEDLKISYNFDKSAKMTGRSAG